MPGDNEGLRHQFTSISNTMSILRGMSKVLCGGIRDRLITDECQKTLEARLGHDVWERWAKLSRKMMRTCLRAFVIGENGLNADLVWTFYSGQLAELAGRHIDQYAQHDRIDAAEVCRTLAKAPDRFVERRDFARLYPTLNAELMSE